MKRSLGLLLAAADAALAVVAGLAAPMLLAVIAWLSRGMGADGWGLASRAGADAWLLAHGAEVDAVLDPTMGASLGSTEILRFPIAFLPLGLTLLTAWFGWRGGARTRRAGLGWDGPVVAVLVVAALAAIVASLASHPYAVVEAWRPALGAALAYGIPALAGARVWRRPAAAASPGGRHGGDDDQAAAAPESALSTALQAFLRTLFGMLAASAAVGAVALLTGLIAGMGRVLGVFQAMHLDPAGVLAVGSSQLAILPNLVVWAFAWCTGAGVELGAGSLASPFATTVAPMPLVPMLGVVPESPAPWLAVALALPIIAGGIGALAPRGLDARGSDEREAADVAVAPRLPLGTRILVNLGAALAAGLIIAAAAWLSGGAVGPGRLQQLGPSPLWTGLLGAGLLALGGLLGGLPPLSFLLGEAPDDEDERPAARPARRGRGATAVGATDELDRDGDGADVDDDLDAMPWWRRERPSHDDEADAADELDDDADEPDYGDDEAPERDDAAADAGPASEPEPDADDADRLDETPAERDRREARTAGDLVAAIRPDEDEPDIYAGIDLDED
ncbi:hypothetical protein USB125703_00351 [Pseudoclavibacter triregionum]|nr:hypothetical protein USB125703_00351 [Pseudoclavibacter triregionum]